MGNSVFIRYRKSRGIHLLVWFENGRERTRSFSHRSDAEREKERMLLQSVGDAADTSAFDALSESDKRSLLKLHEHARLGGYDPWDAIRYYESHSGPIRSIEINVSHAVRSCLQDKKTEGVSQRSLQSLRSVLGRFARKYGDIVVTEVDHSTVSTFVDDMNISLRTRMGYLADLRTLFSWCIQRGYLHKNPALRAMPGRIVRKKLMLTKRSRRKEQVLRVDDCQRLLEWVRKNDPSLLVYPVLCLFAGLRPEREAPRIDWSDINREHITVDASIAKDNETRIIEPLTQNLIGWLELIGLETGYPLPIKNLRRRWDRAKQVLKSWPHDAMRHSYASYHFAMFRDAGLTAKNLGHPSPTLLRKDYNNAVTRAEAVRFWAIAPRG